MTIKNILGGAVFSGLLLAGWYWAGKSILDEHDKIIEYNTLMKQAIYQYADTNKDGIITQNEIESMYDELFQKHNAVHLDNDCVIYKQNGTDVPYDS